MGGNFLRAVQSFYNENRACVRGESGVSEWFDVNVGLSQGSVISPWLFNMYIDGVVREVNDRVLGRGIELLKPEGDVWSVNQLYVVCRCNATVWEFKRESPAVTE